MQVLQFIVEINDKGSMVARGVEQPIEVAADNLAELREKLTSTLAAQGIRPVIISIRETKVVGSA